MNNNGFTLLEILVTISICTLLSIMGFITYNKVTDNYKEKEYNTIVSDFESAAEVYITKSSDKEKKLYSGEESFYNVYLKELSSNNLIDDNIVNPKTNKKFDYNNDYVRITYDGNAGNKKYETKFFIVGK